MGTFVAKEKGEKRKGYFKVNIHKIISTNAGASLKQLKTFNPLCQGEGDRRYDDVHNNIYDSILYGRYLRYVKI